MDYNMEKTFGFGAYMNTFSKLSVLRGLFSDPLLSAFDRWRENESDLARKAEFLSQLFRANAQDDFTAYVTERILLDENPFSRACAAERPVSPYLYRAFLSDLGAIRAELSACHSEDFAVGKPKGLFEGGREDVIGNRLADFYRANGFGPFIKHRAFRYDEADGLIPILSPSEITLDELKGYEHEKEEVRDNLENFVSGLPFADMLLYGDRGTGKSSTVHAMVNEFAPRKLRLVEIAKEDILSLPRLKNRLSEIPLRFVVFIDDFSLAENDERFSTLKAALQGSMEGHSDNVMIVATSNRRHIVEENFDTRSNSVHANDSEQELLSLSDRFGITVLFSTTNKAEYLSIVRALADDARLKTSRAELDMLAERWALLKGGRSPRRAKQFVDYAIACERKEKEIRV